MPKISDNDLYERVKAGNVRVPIRGWPEIRFWAKVDKNGPIHPVYGQCWKWLGSKDRKGYGNFCLRGRRKSHQASWVLHVGMIPDGLHVLHHCDNPECTNPKHLFVGTQKDNTQDMIAKGRAGFGNGKNYNAIVTEEMVEFVKANYIKSSTTNGLRVLGERLGVSLPTVYLIASGKRGATKF